MEKAMKLKYCVMAVVIVCSARIWAEEPADYQERADAAEWTWKKKKADLNYYIKAYKGMYEVSATRPEDAFAWSDYPLKISEAKKVLYEAKVHGGTPFRIRGSTLYVTQHNRSANGCALVAIDLETKKQLWQTHLQGIGVVPHFRYSNQVTLDLDGSVAIVYGHESAGKYIEFVDLKTGKTVANRRFE